MKKTALLALLIAFILPSFAQERPARFRNFSTDDGLPDNSVRSIFQDSNGLIWLCTREGICMYDGLHFKPLEDPNCDILDGLAMSLMEDRQHRLWFVTTLGIGFHDLETGENRTVRRSAARGLVGAADIAVDRNGMVWIANEDRNANNANLMFDVMNDQFVSIDYGCIFNTATFEYPLSHLTSTDTILWSDLFAHIVQGIQKPCFKQFIERLNKEYENSIQQCNLICFDIIEDIPREWNVPQTVIKDKISQLFDEKWLVGVWNNFIECFNDNIHYE